MAKRPTKRKPAPRAVRKPKSQSPGELEILEELKKLREEDARAKRDLYSLSVKGLEGPEGSELARELGVIFGNRLYWNSRLEQIRKRKK